MGRLGGGPEDVDLFFDGGEAVGIGELVIGAEFGGGASEVERRDQFASKKRGRAERFLSTQADHFAGAKWKEKASACSVRNDGLAGEPKELRRLFGLGRSGGLGAGYQARESGGVLDRDIGQDFPI